MTKIEWTTATWNPLAGCSLVSHGCTNCYAMKMAARLERMLPSLTHYRGLTQPSKAGPVWTGKVALAPEHILLEPLKRKKPTTYFVNSMSDLFHEDVPDEWILRVLDVIRIASYDGGSNCGRIDRGHGEHTFQVLTKRSARMRDVMSRLRWDGERLHLLPQNDGRARVLLRNLWLGVSCEDQRRADERIPDLLETPAAIRFISAEPLLGAINLRRLPVGDRIFVDALSGYHEGEALPVTSWVDVQESLKSLPTLPDRSSRLDWVIAGGESGPGARPMHPDWARDLRDQCARTHVAFFFKQHGSWSTVYDRDRDDPDWRRCGAVVSDTPTGEWLNLAGGQGFHGERVVRVIPVSKKAAGRLLDGREWNDMPITHKTEVAA